MRSLNRTELAKKNAGKWLALKADRKTVIASGMSVDEVLQAAHAQGAKHPIITRMAREAKAFIGLHVSAR